MTLNSLDIGVTIKVIYLDLNSIRNIVLMGFTDSRKTVEIKPIGGEIDKL